MRSFRLRRDLGLQLLALSVFFIGLVVVGTLLFESLASQRLEADVEAADLELEEGRLTSLVGANGAGQTTILRTVMGLIRPWQGAVYFDGQNISNLPAHAKAEMGVVLVPEGEQQMLAVARGIMSEPKVLMLDELSLGLAPVLVLGLFQTLKQLKQAGLTMLLVEQNVQMAMAVSDYAYVLAQGQVSLQGPSRELAQDEHVRSAYLGL